MPEITLEISREELGKLADGEKVELEDGDKICLTENARKVFDK